MTIIKIHHTSYNSKTIYEKYILIHLYDNFLQEYKKCKK